MGKFNIIIEDIAKEKKINPTLFFSKKAQKEFLRLVFIDGLESACNEITLWRQELIRRHVLDLLRQ